jgi:hypothetical protein
MLGSLRATLVGKPFGHLAAFRCMLQVVHFQQKPGVVRLEVTRKSNWSADVGSPAASMLALTLSMPRREVLALK